MNVRSVHSKLRIYDEDTVILRETEQHPYMYKILAGSVALYINYGQKDEYLVGILGKSRVFGEIGLLCDKPNIYTAVANERTTLITIDERNLGDFIAGNHVETLNIMRNMANIIQALRANVSMLSMELMSDAELKESRRREINDKMQRYIRSSLFLNPPFFDQKN
ncbi:MAG: cyclic nucleotide-binding domain-containing protein [Lachnospiraceae bacterium]|nr:cyclic nucleotide-binding domain-containing protein [Lachnospiraceae bacterium]